MHRISPGSFQIPSKRIRESIQGNWTVKIGVKFPDFLFRGSYIKGERFWVRVTKPITDGKYEGVVEQTDMVATEAHGIKHGDTITFGPEHILGFNLQ